MGHAPDAVLAFTKRKCDEDLQKVITHITSFLDTVQSMNQHYALEIGDHPPDTGAPEAVQANPQSRTSGARLGRQEGHRPTPAADYFHFLSTLDPSMLVLCDILTVATEILNTPVERFLAQPTSCQYFVKKIRDIGRTWKINPQWAGQKWYFQSLLALARFSRAVQWYQADQHLEKLPREDEAQEPWSFFLSKSSQPQDKGRIQSSWKASLSDFWNKDGSAPESIKDFNIIKTLHKGDSKSVFLAKRIFTNESCAVKVLEKADMFVKNKVTMVHTKRMAILHQMDSHFVSKIHFVFQSKTKVYLVKELLSQGDCNALISSVQHLPEDTTRDYTFQIVQGLDHLHQQGIIHRNLRPENILIDHAHRLKLTDFGISQKAFLRRNIRRDWEEAIDGESVDKHFLAGAQFLRSVCYLTPEAVLGIQDDDASIDWWAFGIVTYEFLYGVTPFQEEDLELVCRKILSGKIDWLGNSPFVPSVIARGFIRSLLDPDAFSRCSFRGAEGVKAQSFFDDIRPNFGTAANGSINPAPGWSPGREPPRKARPNTRNDAHIGPTLIPSSDRSPGNVETHGSRKRPIALTLTQGRTSPEIVPSRSPSSPSILRTASSSSSSLHLTRLAPSRTPEQSPLIPELVEWDDDRQTWEGSPTSTWDKIKATFRQKSNMDISPTHRRRSSSGRSTPSSASKYWPGLRRRTSSRNSSDGRGSAWLSGYTTTDSDDDDVSIDSRFPSYSPGEWDISDDGRPSDQLLLKDLDWTGMVNNLDKYPFESGGVADIYRGILKSSNSPVAVKIFRRMHAERETLERTSRYLYQEARVWRQLDHPNILPFLGISLDLGLSPALISPYCAAGPVMKHLQHNNHGPVQKLQLAIGVANGLSYLHSEGIVHGNLCTKKILIDDNGSPVICGYGMSKALQQPAYTTSLFSSPIRFASPECFSVKGNTASIRTSAGDVYSFSMIALEILSGLQPYHHLPTEHGVFIHIVRGGRPIRTHLDPLAITKSMWRFLTSLWHEDPALRPEMPAVVQALVRMRDEEDTSDEQDSPGERESSDPESFSCQEERQSSSGSEASDSLGDIALPELNGRNLKGRVTQDDQYPFAGGGNSNIYRGKLTRSNGRKIRVAIKMIRMSDDGSGQVEEIMRRLKREVDVWARLKHRNVLPFIGVCDDIAPWPVLVSPFYKFGHVGTYLKKHPSTNRQDLVRGVASGLQYLHAHDIVHGDLKVQNVLVDKRGSPFICDFGISKIINRQGFTTSSVGTAPYMAPELFFVVDDASSTQEEASPSTTKSSDVYSFALLVLEILTSEPPKGRPSRPIVTAKILADLRPKPADYDENKVTADTWSILDRCWSFDPQLRPVIFEVLRELNSNFQPKTVDSGIFEAEFMKHMDIAGES